MNNASLTPSHIGADGWTMCGADGAPATCDANPWYTACPHDCFSQGDCRLQDGEHVCVCQDGYQGPDCSAGEPPAATAYVYVLPSRPPRALVSPCV